jgi:hypothetical protein
MLRLTPSCQIDLRIIQEAQSATANEPIEFKTSSASGTVQVLMESDGGYAVQLKLGDSDPISILLTSQRELKEGQPSNISLYSEISLSLVMKDTLNFIREVLQGITPPKPTSQT